MDCAFTIAFNPKYDPLLDAVKAATNTGRFVGLKLCGLFDSSAHLRCCMMHCDLHLSACNRCFGHDEPS